MQGKSWSMETWRVRATAALQVDRRRSRLARFEDAASAEDDYYRFDNRNA